MIIIKTNNKYNIVYVYIYMNIYIYIYIHMVRDNQEEVHVGSLSTELCVFFIAL